MLSLFGIAEQEYEQNYLVGEWRKGRLNGKMEIEENGDNDQNQGNSIFRSYASDMEKTVVNRMGLLGLEQRLLSKRLAINTSSQLAEIESQLHISLFIHI